MLENNQQNQEVVIFDAQEGEIPAWKALDKIKDPLTRAYIENALQDQAEREKGCEYCDPSTPDYEWRQEWAIEGKSPTDDVHLMQINFCPICGRDLRKPVEK